MREGQFIQRNKERWEEYKIPTEDPDETAKRFANLVDDLGYAKTHYPFSSVIKYVNGIAAPIYLSIYKNKKENRSRIIDFLKTELPLILYHNRKTLRFAFLFFLFFVIIGAFSAWQNPDFIRGFLGDNYVEMTENNIAKGDPFGVYKEENELIMFLQIAWNNISIMMKTFTLGIFCSIGTLYLLFTNGLMIGCFEQMFFAHGLGFKSILTIFIHGTLEISAIIISGGAGMIMGNAILFPKTFTRAQSLKRAAKDGIKIMLSLIPIIVLAGFLEGYITRHTEMPIALSLFILLASLAYILWYYVYYPIKVHQQQESKNKGY